MTARLRHHRRLALLLAALTLLTVSPKLPDDLDLRCKYAPPPAQVVSP